MPFQATLCRRFMSQLTLLLIVALFVSACGAAPAAPATGETATPEATVAASAEATPSEAAATDSLFPLTITDAAGVEYTFDAPPKIGCWWAGCTEMFADLGVVAHASSYTDETANSVFNFPVGAPPQNIADTQNPEMWAAAEVDLILMRVPVDPAQEPIKAAAPIFYMHHPSYGESSEQGYAAFEENLRLVGQLTDQPAAAEAAIARFDTVIENLRAFSTPETQALSVAVLFQGDGYRVIGPGNPFCVALAEAQLGQCVGEGAASYEINAEEFLGLDPDWLVYQSGDASYQDRTDPVWGELTAVKEGRVYDAGGNRYYCCSLRGLIHALQEYVSHVLPEAGIPDPGPHLDFDPLQSPLVQPAAATTGPSLFPLTITDATGQEFTFDAPPKIGCGWLGCDEILADLGVVPQASWHIRHESTFLAPAGISPHQIADMANPEEWAMAEIDLLVKRGPATPDDEAVAEAAPIFYLHFPSADANALDGIAAYYENTRLLGQLTGRPDLAEATLARFDILQEKLRGLATDETRALSVAVLFGEPATYHAIGHVNPFCTVLADVGLGQCIESPWWDEINAEAFLGYDPDWIVYMDLSWPTFVGGDEVSFDERTDLIWPQLTAVKEGRVYKAATQRFDCCSTRMLTHALQDYVSHILPAAGIPTPGPLADFDPAQSPLVQPE